MNRNKTPLSSLVADLDEDGVLEAVRQRLAAGADPFLVMDECQVGIMQVGEFYEQGKYYISGLIMAGQIMQQVSQMVLPVLQERISGSDMGRILVGTVQGDIHYIGKNIFKILLQCFGFTVHDAGEDVPPAEFVRQALQFAPRVIGISCLLSTSYDSLRETIRLLRKESGDLQIPPRTIIGGRLDAEVSRYVEADYWAKDAMSGVRICQDITANEAARSA